MDITYIIEPLLWYAFRNIVISVNEIWFSLFSDSVNFKQPDPDIANKR